MSLVPGGGGNKKNGGGGERWIIPASDLKGNGVRRTFRLPPHMAEWLKRVVQSRELPFYGKGEGYVMRKGLEMVLKHCEELTGEFKTENMIFTTCTDIIRQQERLVEHRELLTYAESVVDRVVKAGVRGEARRTVKRLRDELEKLDDDAWKKNLLKQFDRKMKVYMEEEDE